MKGDITCINVAGIAALLVPLHYRLEKWATHKLVVEKNKAIRLANAKKTIEESENHKQPE
jgi:hypothetical protein